MEKNKCLNCKYPLVAAASSGDSRITAICPNCGIWYADSDPVAISIGNEIRSLEDGDTDSDTNTSN